MDGLRVRQLVVFGCLFAGYTMYVVCRKDFAFVIPVIGKSDEAMDNEDMGAIVSSQNLAYAVAKFVLGVFSDYVDARYLFFSGLCAAAGSVCLFASVRSVPMYCAAWFANGLAQGCGWPAEAKLLRQWFHPDTLGTVWSLGSASSNVAGSVVPALLPILLPLAGGWRPFMIGTGGAAVLMAFVFLLLVRNSPEECGYPAVNPQLKQANKPSAKSGKTGGSQATWGDMLKSPLLWLISVYYLVGFAAKVSVENWMQLYLMREKHLAQSQSAAFMSSFETGGFISSVLTGYLTDWMMKRRDPKSSANPRLDLCLLYSVLAVGITYAITIYDEYLGVLGFAYGFVLYGKINIYGLVATEAAPVHLSGSSHAIVALASNLGAVVAGLPFSMLASHYDWASVFSLLAAALLFCASLMAVTRGWCTSIAGGVQADGEDKLSSGSDSTPDKSSGSARRKKRKQN